MRTLTIQYDELTESIHGIDASEFKSTAMVLAVLGMAQEEAKFRQGMERVKAQQQAAQQVMQQQAVAQQNAQKITGHVLRGR